jgi:hypothetical protein
MISSTEPGLTEALYMSYIRTFNKMQNVNFFILTTDIQLTVTLANDRPILSSASNCLTEIKTKPYIDALYQHRLAD